MKADANKVKGFLLYRIYYGDTIVYVGRTKQPLQDRIRGHLFQKPMHRSISIELVTKIEYAEFKTEADMNLYEIFFILKWHPPLNVDDKTRDYPTVELPDVRWNEFNTPLWEKWRTEILEKENEYDKILRRIREIPEQMRVVRSMFKVGDIDGDEMMERIGSLSEELNEAREKLYR